MVQVQIIAMKGVVQEVVVSILLTVTGTYPQVGTQVKKCYQKSLLLGLYHDKKNQFRPNIKKLNLAFWPGVQNHAFSTALRFQNNMLGVGQGFCHSQTLFWCQCPFVNESYFLGWSLNRTSTYIEHKSSSLMMHWSFLQNQKYFDNVSVQKSYSRVHISWNIVFSKILKKPSIVQK